MTTAPKKRFVPPSGWRRDRITDELITTGRKPKIEYRYNFTLGGNAFTDVEHRVRRVWKDGLDLERQIAPEAAAQAETAGIELDKFDLKLAGRQIGLERTPRTFRSFYEAAFEREIHPDTLLWDLQGAVENARGFAKFGRYIEAYKELTSACYVIYYYAGATWRD